MNRQTESGNDCVVRRRIALAKAPAEEAAHRLISALQSAEGVRSASLGGDKRRLEVSYDVRQTSFDRIVEVCRHEGCGPRESGSSKLRAAWYRFTEQNIRDNAGHHPHCCNKPPA